MSSVIKLHRNSLQQHR